MSTKNQENVETKNAEGENTESADTKRKKVKWGTQRKEYVEKRHVDKDVFWLAIREKISFILTKKEKCEKYHGYCLLKMISYIHRSEDPNCQAAVLEQLRGYSMLFWE